MILKSMWGKGIYPGVLPNPGIELGSPASQADSLPAEPPGKPLSTVPAIDIHFRDFPGGPVAKNPTIQGEFEKDKNCLLIETNGLNFVEPPWD